MTHSELLAEIRRLFRLIDAAEKRAVALIDKMTAARLRMQLMLKKLGKEKRR